MLRAMRRELETALRILLTGHEGGNPGYSQGESYGLPRQLSTLPGAGGQAPEDTSFMLPIVRNDRPAFVAQDLFRGTDAEVRSAFEGHASYFGTYTVDPVKQ